MLIKVSEEPLICSFVTEPILNDPYIIFWKNVVKRIGNSKILDIALVKDDDET